MPAGRESIGTIDELHADASRITGLSDFGDNGYRDGLRILLDAYACEAGLTAWGNRVNHAQLRGALVARLLSESGWRQHPEHDRVEIERPIFVTGLPRTGTTALHRLLCEDPAHQGLEMWLTEAPQPRPPRATWASNPIFQRVEEGYRRHHIENPEFMGLHYMSAGTVEECWQLLRQSMQSIAFENLAHVPAYSAWLRRQDWTPAYARHRRNLQLIGLPDAGRRWVLKNPSHIFALDAIMSVYPDAMIIQTHRDPKNVIASVSSLTSQATAGQSDLFVGAVIGRAQLELWARGADQFMADRRRHDPARFIDVRYAEFTADPVGVVAAIYARFGIELTPEARAAMTVVHEQSVSGERRPSHRYELAEFGLTAEEVDARFAEYRAHYLED